MNKEKISEIADRIIASGKGASKEEALQLIATQDIDALCDAADRICRAFHPRKIDSCSIVNARSGMCGQDCKWCAQTKHHDTGCVTYNFLDEDKTMEAAAANEKHGIRRFSLVTSGRAVSDKDLDHFCHIYDRLNKETDLYLCASMGLINEQQLQRLKDSGVKRYHCNMETSARMWPSLVTTHTQEDKRKTIEAAKKVGMEICSGGIIGMGEDAEDRIDFAIMMREMDVDSVPMNILNPIKGTLLEDTPLIAEDEIVRCAAVWRFLMPKQTIRFAGGRMRLSEKNMKRILLGGVNGALMGDMLTTVGNSVEEDKQMYRSLDWDC